MSERNLFHDLPADFPSELTDVLVENRFVRIERIVSTGQSSPEGFWYDQDQAEWVVVLTGEAHLLMDDNSEPVSLRPGDHLLIPAHRKHRVDWTTPQEATVWLAVFFYDSEYFVSDLGRRPIRRLDTWMPLALPVRFLPTRRVCCRVAALYNVVSVAIGAKRCNQVFS